MLAVFSLGCLLCLSSFVSSQILSLPISRPKLPSYSRGLLGISGPSALVGCTASGFSTAVTIGGTVFQLLVNTGSSNLAVASSQCAQCTQLTNDGTTTINIQPRYNPGPTSTNLYVAAAEAYGDGNWTGSIYKDIVGIDGSSLFWLTFAKIDTQNSVFRPSNCEGPEVANPYQGVLGFAYPSLLYPPAELLISKLVSTGFIAKDMFALQMCRTTGLLWLGGYDTSYFTGDLVYTPIVNDIDNQLDFYNVGFTGFKIQGVSITVSSAAFTPAPVDSANSGIQFDDAIYNALVSALLANSYFTTQFPSSGGKNFFEAGFCVRPTSVTTTAILNQQLPTITFLLYGVELTLLAISSYLYELESYGDLYYCPGIFPGGTGRGSNIFGWSFMNQFVTVFDRVNQQIGFAPAYACGPTWTQVDVTCVDQYAL